MALASLIVSSHVHAECGHTDVDFVAMGASSGLLISQRPVCLPMPSQIRGRRILLATVGTLVIFVVVRLGVRDGGSTVLRCAQRRRYRRRIEARNDLHLPAETSQFLLRARGEAPRRQTHTQGGAVLGTSLQSLPLDLDSLEEVPRPFGQSLIPIIRHLDRRSRQQRSALLRMLCDPGRRWSLMDDIIVMNQGASRRRQAHLRQLRQVVQLLRALGRRLAAAFAGAIGSWLTRAVIDQSRGAPLGTEI